MAGKATDSGDPQRVVLDSLPVHQRSPGHAHPQEDAGGGAAQKRSRADDGRKRERRSGLVRPAGHDPLTPFERRLLELLSAGLNRTEIARALDRSPQTISNSLTVAKEKLGARSLTQAAVLMVQRSTRLASRRRQSMSR
jgi:DNA-binding NarL/FixJ family response regulator